MCMCQITVHILKMLWQRLCIGLVFIADLAAARLPGLAAARTCCRQCPAPQAGCRGQGVCLVCAYAENAPTSPSPQGHSLAIPLAASMPALAAACACHRNAGPLQRGAEARRASGNLKQLLSSPGNAAVGRARAAGSWRAGRCWSRRQQGAGQTAARRGTWRLSQGLGLGQVLSLATRWRRCFRAPTPPRARTAGPRRAAAATVRSPWSQKPCSFAKKESCWTCACACALLMCSWATDINRRERLLLMCCLAGFAAKRAP